MIGRLIFILFLFAACQESGDPAYRDQRRRNQKGEYIHRSSYEFTQIPPMILTTPEPYAWEERFSGNLAKITKEHFRCKGTSFNPPFMRDKVRVADCGKHTLPLRDGKEYVYPILIELLNYLQFKTNKKVIITCGHRCIDHNIYVGGPTYSKHIIGAEVAFYVQGMESEPGLIIKYLIDYYKDHSNSQYREFKRYDKNDSSVATQPWFNKEIFIKLFSKTEGRDFDNSHPYPFISIQVRLDGNKPVSYTWPQANNYYRY